MPDNIVEKAIVPYNPSSYTIRHNNRYNLFAPIGGINKVGMAGYNPDDFEVDNQIVSISAKFKNSINTELDKKVDKIDGKELSTNDFTDELKENYDDANNKKHTHSNKSILDEIQVAFTTALKNAYDDANAKKHTHSNKEILDAVQVAFTTALKNAYDDANAKKHTHSNKEILDAVQVAFTTALKNAYDDANAKKHTHSNKEILDAVTAAFTEELKQKLVALESSHFRGQFAGLSLLQAALPTANVGDYAYVDSADVPVQKYIWDSSDNEWVPAVGIAGEETPASIKQKYESNSDTNAYTDAEKDKVANLKPHAFNDLATSLGTETDKAPTNKLLNDTAALKVDKTSISTVMPISSDAASNEKVLSEKVVYDEFAKTSRTIYDKIIRTQDEFDALIADPDWLGATSVALVGQFTVSRANGIKVPDSVKQIHGFNNAKITVTNFVHDESTAKGGLWYDELPTTLDYSIRDLEVDCTGTGAFGYGFRNCTNLTNCTGKGTGYINGIGFYGCTNLTNCKGTGTESINGIGFYGCMNLTNCTGEGTGAGAFGYGFRYCTNLTNCTGSGTGDSGGYGFRDCANLTNCTGTGAGTGAGAEGYGFYNITYASNCKDGGSSTAMWGGINKNIGIPAYDKIIRTQDEFEELIDDPDWLGTKSVAIVGQFTVSRENGIKIPQTVKQIHGFNNAKITITNFVHHPDTAKGGLWYDTRPTTLDYSIRDLEVDCTGVYVGNGFYNCTNLTNCTGTGTGETESGSGFSNCTNLTNCTGTGTGDAGGGFSNCTNLTNCTGTGTGDFGHGFFNCTNLTNCTGTGTGTWLEGYGFRKCRNLMNCTGTGIGYVCVGFSECTDLTNCTGTGTGTRGYGFRYCTNLTNCTGTGTGSEGYGFRDCTSLTNCTGTGTGTGTESVGYGFYNINYASNCRDGGSTTAMWGGTNENIGIDDSTAQTIAGVKTFSSSPIVPTPSVGGAAANKDYVDTAIGNIGSVLDAINGEVI